MDGQEQASCALALNLRKPSSLESRLISELATEVAYLVGTRASRCKSPRIPQSPSRLGEMTMPSEHQHEGLPIPKVAVGLAAGRQDTGQGAENEREPEPPTNNATAVEPGGLGACTEKVLDNVATPAKSGGRGVVTGDGDVTGRPGTYSGCGVTSCKGLGFTGQHGDVKGNIPHAPFVIREVDNVDSGGENAASDKGDKGDTPCANLSSDGSGAAEQVVTDENDVGSSIASSPDVVVATPLALLSAREASFRNELIRRKEHYSLGGTREEVGVNGHGEPGGSFQASAILEQKNRKGYRGPSAAVERGRPMEAPQRFPSRKTLGGSSPAPVDVAESPLMASTRPTGVHPTPDLNNRREGNRRIAGATPGKKGIVPGDREYVKFARPAAHWSVTNSLSKSPGRARSKGVRVPNCADEAGGLVVGRFACRGYLLDPTFTDHNPIIMHSRLPLIAGGGGGFNQVPEDSTLAELIALPEAKGGASSAGLKGVEPYRNVVEVFRHNVGVSGAREAGKQTCNGDQGPPLSPVKFHQV